jgi:hypothetical protein
LAVWRTCAFSVVDEAIGDLPQLRRIGADREGDDIRPGTLMPASSSHLVVELPRRRHVDGIWLVDIDFW